MEGEFRRVCVDQPGSLKAILPDKEIMTRMDGHTGSVTQCEGTAS
jgi:hypothetical protein